MAKDMKVYHGTSSSYLKEILAKGIVPRSETGNSNWDHTVKSREEFVYLTTAYAPYFAGQAVQKEEKALVLEIDLDLLDSRKLYPDEDAIGQSIMAQRDKTNNPVFSTQKEADQWDMTLNELTDSLDMEEYRQFWKGSLDKMGNIAYKGTIPPEAITRYVTIDFSKHRDIYMMVLDPTISIMNYMICGQKYRDITSWLFKDRDLLPLGITGSETEEQMVELANMGGKEFKKQHLNHLKYLKKLSKKRQGIHVESRTGI